MSGPRGPGRPATRLPGGTAKRSRGAGAGQRSKGAGATLTKADRASAWRADLVRQGGKQIAVNLLPHEVRALGLLAKRGERGPTIGRLLVAEVERLVAAGELPPVDLRSPG